ncbi:MAG: hypothetical protein DRN15_03660 [Thermoprotei archaeon]|nr:MAG: hypothetical protein DRM97_04765 [Thermoprotei archaeon]RLF24223.1 MAG: hypothetical protein DRN15_03660 [Thermoprotei archaeon]
MRRQRVAAKVYYDGTCFRGFQRQPHGETVEDFLLRALMDEGIVDDPKEARWAHASRTDRGVSALGQVVAFTTDRDLALEIINRPMRINRRLLPKACMWAFSLVSPDFNPRRDALTRHYKYLAPYMGEDVQSMKRAAHVLSGTHDYSFLGVSDEQSIRSMSIEVNVRDGFIEVDVKGPGFYRGLIRACVMALLKVGRGELLIKELEYALRERKLIKGLGLAPPEGLILWNVTYKNVVFKVDRVTLLRVIRILTDKVYKFYTLGKVYDVMRRAFENSISSCT